jgi:hypothetical protein
MSNIFRNTNPITTQGDAVVGDANGVPSRLAIGTKGFVPQSNGTTLAYVPGQTDTNRITASYTVLDNDGYRTIIATTAPSNVTFSSRSSDTVTFTGAHGMLTGCPIAFNGAGTPPTGLTSGTEYYAIVTSTTACKFATSIANALAGTAVTLSGDGSSTRTWAPGIAVVLPTAADNTDRVLVVKKDYATSAPAVAVVPEASGETLDGGIGIVISTQHASRTVVCENSLWYVVGRVISNTRYQKKNLAASLSSSTDPVTDLGFANLTIGRIYRLSITAQIQITGTTSTESSSLVANHNGAALLFISFRQDGQSDESNWGGGNSTVFVATATTITFDFNRASGGNLIGDATSPNATYAILEELPAHEVTSAW